MRIFYYITLHFRDTTPRLPEEENVVARSPLHLAPLLQLRARLNTRDATPNHLSHPHLLRLLSLTLTTASMSAMLSQTWTTTP